MPKRQRLTNNSDETDITSLLSGDTVFAIPYFQRAYKWKPERLEQLNLDLLSLVDKTSDFHFLGAIIIHGRRSNPSEPDVYEVIDGQQPAAEIPSVLCEGSVRSRSMPMKATFALVAVVLLNLPASGADPKPYLKSAPMPFYPPLARAARIEGKVSLHFIVDEHGDTSEVEATTGHELLRRGAIENVQNWKFGWPNPCACRVKKEAVFVYGFSGELETEESPTVAIKWFGKPTPIRVEIKAGEFPLETQNNH